MPVLTVVRHAKSAWDDPALDDHDRPLADRGRRDAPLVAEHLAATLPAPDLVRCSSATRAQETATLLRPWTQAAPVTTEAAIYGASAGELRDLLRQTSEDHGHVALVGHNPGLAQLLVGLAASPDHAADRIGKLPTCAAVTLETDGPWPTLDWRGARLRTVVTPKDVARSKGVDR